MQADCPVSKNEEYILTIQSMGSEGEGIGRIDGYTLFVEGALIEEKVRVKVIKVKKNYGVAKLLEVIEASDLRVEPVCPIAKRCGGCNLQHQSYEGQGQFKAQKIRDALERIGGLDSEIVAQTEEEFLLSDPNLYYRNKVQFPVQEGPDGKVKIGFYAKRSHEIIETPRCYIQDTYNEKIIETIRHFIVDHRISVYDEARHKGLLRHIMIRKSEKRDSYFVTLVINGKTLPSVDKLSEKLLDLGKVESLSLNINTKRTNVILGRQEKHIMGPQYLIDTIGDLSYRISPQSFYQVNSNQTERLYDKALSYAGLTGEETVFDLYCGIGTISLFLAKKAKKVYGVEIVAEAVQDAKANAAMNAIDNAEFFEGKAEEVTKDIYDQEKVKADVLVVDPPRKGCDEKLLETILVMSPKRIVYVSCNPATLARDIAYLGAKGYDLEKWCGVDMFPMTGHVESVILLHRKNI